MALVTGELTGLSGKLLLMTATATKKTIRVLQNQFPEVSKWKLILNLPVRRNVTILIPPPDIISTSFEVTLRPFINSMRQEQKTFLILVRGWCHKYNVSYYTVEQLNSHVEYSLKFI